MAQIVDVELLSDIYQHYVAFMDTEQVHSSSESVPYLIGRPRMKPHLFSSIVQMKNGPFEAFGTFSEL